MGDAVYKYPDFSAPALPFQSASMTPFRSAKSRTALRWAREGKSGHYIWSTSEPMGSRSFPPPLCHSTGRENPAALQMSANEGENHQREVMTAFLWRKKSEGGWENGHFVPMKRNTGSAPRATVQSWGWTKMTAITNFSTSCFVTAPRLPWTTWGVYLFIQSVRRQIQGRFHRDSFLTSDRRFVQFSKSEWKITCRHKDWA